MSPKSYGRFEKGFPVIVNTTENKAPMAVGVTALSSMDMYMAGRQGRGVSILHVYRDLLWEMGSKTPPPSLGVPDIVADTMVPPPGECLLLMPPQCLEDLILHFFTYASLLLSPFMPTGLFIACLAV